MIRGNTRIRNNSHILFEEVGLSTLTNLVCLTNKSLCCNSDDGSWYHPDGSRVMTVAQGCNFFQIVSKQTVVLLRSTFANFPSGIFHCEISDAANIKRKLYIGIYKNGTGNFFTPSFIKHKVMNLFL